MVKRVQGWKASKNYALFVEGGDLGEDCTPVIVQNALIIQDQAVNLVTGGQLVRFAYNVDPDNTIFGPVVNLNPSGPAATRAELDNLSITFSSITLEALDQYPPFKITVDIGDPQIAFPVQPQSYGIPIINPNGCTSYLEFIFATATGDGVL